MSIYDIMISKRSTSSFKRGLKRGIEKINTRWFTILIVSIILSSGILVYSADDIYGANKSRVKAMLPSDYSGGERINFPVIVSDLEGDPQMGKEVRVYLKREEQTSLMYEGLTSQDGMTHVDFELPDGDFKADLLIKGGREVIERTIEVRGKTRLFVSTDKPIYQPSQTVHIRSLCFVGDEPLDDGNKVTYTIKTPDGDKIFRKSFTPDEYGISYYNYTLSDLLPLGAYELKVSALGKTVKESFLVDEYVMPRFKINYRGLDDWYLFGDSMSGTIDAGYFFGRKVEGNAEVKMRYEDETKSYQGSLQDGQLPFYFELPEEGEEEHITLNATVRDTSEHEEWKTLDIPIADRPINFDLASSKNIVDIRSMFRVRLSHPDGSAMSGRKVEASLDSRSLPSKTIAEDGSVYWNLTYKGEESLKVTTDFEGKKYSRVFDLDKDEGVKVIPKLGGNKVGSEKEFLVYYKGGSLSDRVYYTVQTKKNILYSDYFVMKEQPYLLSIPVVYGMAPEYRVTVHTLEKDLDYSVDSVEVGVNNSEYLDLDVSTRKETYLPGENCTIKFRFTMNGAPSSAAVGVKITDEALYSLNQLSGMDKILVNQSEENKTEVGFEVLEAGESMKQAENVEDRLVAGYWTILIMVGFTSLFILFVLSLHSKPIAACLMAGIILLGSFAFVGYYAFLPESQSASTRDPGREDGLEEGAPGIGIGEQKDAAPTDEHREKEPPTDEKGSEDTGEIRKYFPETWYWNPTLITGPDGNATLDLQTPDSITNWIIEGVASTKEGEMNGETENLTVFKEFFIEPDIPVSAVRNDRFDLRVMVYNYQNSSVDAEVVLQGADWFQLHDSAHKTISLGPEEVGNVTYNITAKAVGTNKLKLVAIGDGQKDIIHKMMKVEPDGKKKVKAVNGQLTNEETVNITFSPDEDHIPGSRSAFVKLYGSMNSVTLDSAEGFIHKVSGCGEQSMSTLSIDVLAYDIAKNSEHPPEDMEHYERIVVQGIQHELGFLKEAQNGEGRGIVWFPSDKDVHPWLTSWGLITFSDVKDAGLTIDDAVIKDMQDWLVSQQDPNGSWEFPERGLYETTNQVLRAKKVATTSYITRALIYSGYDTSSSAVEKGIGYIKEHVEKHWDDPYTLSMASICLKSAGEEQSEYSEILERIYELRIEKGQLCHWESDVSLLQGSNSLYERAGSKNIETTGYAIMALRGEGYSEVTDKAVQFLLENRNEFGTFFSTQDTVVALQALKGGDEIEIDDMNVSIYMNGEKVSDISFTEKNKDLTYLVDLREYIEEENRVNITSSGEGKVAYQVIYEEYIPWEIVKQESISFEASVPSRGELGEELTLSLNLTYKDGAPYSKMGIAVIPIPTGFKTLDYDHLLEKEKVSNIEVKGQELRIYLSNMKENSEVNLRVDFIPSNSGSIQVQGIHYYDMYNPSIRLDTTPERIDITEKTI